MTFHSSHASLLSSYPIPDSANFELSPQAPSSVDVSGSKKVPDSRSHLAASPSDQIRHHDLPTLTASKTSGISPPAISTISTPPAHRPDLPIHSECSSPQTDERLTRRSVRLIDGPPPHTPAKVVTRAHKETEQKHAYPSIGRYPTLV